MSTLYITRGLPASGKTTWAKAWVAEDPAGRARINRDDFRFMMYAEPDYSWAQEAAVTQASRTAVRALLETGRDVVADDMNLRPKYVREWVKFAATIGAGTEVVEFPVTVETSVERDAARERSVGADTIRQMASKYLRKGDLQPIPDEPPPGEAARAAAGELYEAKPGTPAAIIVDIDGTLALMGERSPYDLGKVSDDLPNAAVIEAARAAAASGVQVIYCSGREDTAREATAAWLTRHVGVPGPLHMRAAKDGRKDSIVKRELFDAHIREEWDVRYVLDDRQQVVDMWRELGLTVFQVAKGDF